MRFGYARLPLMAGEQSGPSYWDSQAPTFDEEPDHGLTDGAVRSAWISRLVGWLPDRVCRVADLGCGTGSLSVLAAQLGHSVVGIDLSPAMVDQASAKAKRHGLNIRFSVGDASHPDLPVGEFDVVLVRHVIWALVSPPESTSRWASLLRRDGRLVAIEGLWKGGGISADALTDVVEPLFHDVAVEHLSTDSALWGRPVHDQRYALIANRPRPIKHP